MEVLLSSLDVLRKADAGRAFGVDFKGEVLQLTGAFEVLQRTAGLARAGVSFPGPASRQAEESPGGMGARAQRAKGEIPGLSESMGNALFPAVERVLTRLSAFARRLAEGGKDYPGSVAEKGRVGDWRGNGRRMGVAVAGGFRNAGASLPAMAPFPVAALRTGHADLPHPALQWDHASRTRNTLATTGSR